MPVPHPPLHFTHPLPYGAIPHNGGVHFVVYSHSATAMRVLLYDQLADRWLLSEFSGTVNLLCVYISQTNDPTDNLWYEYSFATPNFPDYP